MTNTEKPSIEEMTKYLEEKSPGRLETLKDNWEGNVPEDSIEYFYEMEKSKEEKYDR